MNKLSIADMEKLKCAREKITAAKTFANTVENTLVLFCLDWWKMFKPHSSTTPRKKLFRYGASTVDKKDGWADEMRVAWNYRSPGKVQ